MRVYGGLRGFTGVLWGFIGVYRGLWGFMGVLWRFYGVLWGFIGVWEGLWGSDRGFGGFPRGTLNKWGVDRSFAGFMGFGGFRGEYRVGIGMG